MSNATSLTTIYQRFFFGFLIKTSNNFEEANERKHLKKNPSQEE